MIELTEEEFKGDLDKYTIRIENGEDFPLYPFWIDKVDMPITEEDESDLPF